MADGLRVLVPSYKRGKELNPTAEYLPFVQFVVAESEAEEYRRSGHRVLICPDSAQGSMPRIRNWVLENNNDAEILILMDDDVTAIHRWSDQKPIKLSAEEVEEFMEMASNLAIEWGFGLWGVNPFMDKGTYREYSPFSTLCRVGGPLLGIVKNELRFDERLRLKGDDDFSIQHLNHFRGLLRMNQYYLEHDFRGKAGGCQTYRTEAFELSMNRLLIKKWGSRIVKEVPDNPMCSRIRVPIAGI